jgi:TetR/AcrR family transcriptional regulator, cholesterol catabolism regulator
MLFLYTNNLHSMKPLFNESNVEELIISTAFGLMKKFGIRNFNMDMLVAETGLSKKVIYPYYATKEEILAECVKHAIEELRKKNRMITETDANPVLKAIEILEVNLFNGLTFQDSFLFDLKKYHSSVYQLMDEYTRELFCTTILDLLKEAQKAGIILKEVECNISCEFYMLKLREVVTCSHAYIMQNFETIFNHLIVYSIRGLLSDEHTHLLDDRLRKHD